MLKNFIKRVASVFSEKRLSTVAGAWVFYFLTSVIPLVFLLITVFGVFGVDVTSDIVSRLPEEFRVAGETIVFTARSASKGATLLFILTAAYSCVRLLNQMSKDGDHIYLAKSAVKRGVMRKVWALFALASLFVVFLGVAVIVAFGNKIFNFSFLVGGVKKLISAIFVAFLIIAISYLIIILLNVFISPIKMKFKDVAVGGLFSLFFIVLGTIGFALYVRIFNSYNAFYGSLASVVAFLFWVYILMLGMVVGVIINAKIYNRRVRVRN